jgi:acyl-homoserine lactone acylase PvdQ
MGRSHGPGGFAAAALLLALAFPVGAAAQETDVSSEDFGGFRNVLPGGQGETVNEDELAAYTASGEPPESFTDQLPLYEGVMRAAPTLSASELDDYFKPAAFGVAPGQVASEVRPRQGVLIQRDAAYGVPHVFGATRADTMFGAGYATAEDRLFVMDVLRHAARARLTELIGPGTNNSTVRMDAEQLKVADYSEAELREMIGTAVATAGREGEQILGDLRAYVAGINKYIAEARMESAKMPVEYAALGFPEGPEDWKQTDTVAVASLIGSVFGRGGGSEALASQALAAAEKRFSNPAVARAVFEDFRAEEDPEAPVTTTTRFEFDDPGPVNPDAVALPDLGSIEERDPVVSNSSDEDGGIPGAPGWLEQLQQEGLGFPATASNALLVTGERSASGGPLAVMGPQVGYWSPQILMELDLHGPGIHARGATFPGISLYVLLGRGKDFAWSATSATTDNVDEFVERLCEPDGSEPTMKSDHYLYEGECIPFETRKHVLRTRPTPTDPTAPPQTFTLQAERSVHGPIQARAQVDGAPVAIAEARSTYFHELESAVAFKRLNGNEIQSAADFQRAMHEVNFTFNWFYADDRDIAYFHSGWFPRRAGGTDPSLPTWGTGKYDWQGFDPDSYSSNRMPFAEHPREINPARGYIVNWNNKQAPGWRAADDQFSYGPVHRSERLEDRVREALATGDREIHLAELVRFMEIAATVDLRGQEVYPLLRATIGDRGGVYASKLLGILDSWVADGSHRRDLDGDNVLEHSPAVALMDEWWPLLLARIFEPVLGHDLTGRIRTLMDYDQPPPPEGSAYASGWWGYLDKDLRALLGRPVEQPLSRPYCGEGDRTVCVNVLLATLEQAADKALGRYGVSEIEQIERPATCPGDSTHPRDCDQIQFTALGAVETDPIHWQDRPTFQQVVAVEGHRPR